MVAETLFLLRNWAFGLKAWVLLLELISRHYSIDMAPEMYRELNGCRNYSELNSHNQTLFMQGLIEQTL